jgi:hypothetical protein
MTPSPMNSNSDPLHSAVSETIDGNPDLVQLWLRDAPGSWGALAGKGVLAYRRLLDRKLTDLERRQVWALLWESLAGLRHSP